MKHFNNYLSRRDASACLEEGVERVTLTPTALKQTPEATLELLRRKGVEISKVAFRGRPRRLREGSVRRILVMRQEELSFYKIARITGVPKSTAYDYWRRFRGVKVRDGERREVEFTEARKLFKSILDLGLGEETTALARRGLASSSMEEIAYILEEIQDIIHG